MNIRRIEDIGGTNAIDAIVEIEDGKFAHKFVLAFWKYKTPHIYDINIDNISYVKHSTFDVGKYECKKNPLYTGWFGWEKKIEDFFTKTGTIDVIEIHMVDRNVFYISADSAPDWIK